MKLPINVLNFAGHKQEICDIYEGVVDLYKHHMSEVEHEDCGSFDSRCSLSEKESKINTQMLGEIARLSGTKPDGVSFEAWAKNPTVAWASFQVMGMMIEAVLANTINRAISPYVELKPADYGEPAIFDVKPNHLLTVSKAGNKKRTAQIQKEHSTTITLVPEARELSIGVSLYKVLAKRESLADLVKKAVISLEREMTSDAYGALASLVSNANFPTELKETGYTQKGLLKKCQTVTAYNNGQKAVIMGTTQALADILPSSALGYRIVTSSDNMSIQVIKNFFGYDVLEVPQVATGKDYGLALDDDKLYIISPSGDKIIKGAIEGNTLANTSDFYQNADLSSVATFVKRWKFEAITNSTMAVITLQ